MNYQEAQQYSLTVRWKVSVCHSGKKCWCRIIEPEIPITDDDGNEIYINNSGSITKEHAEYIVNLHNNSIK